MLRSVEAVAFSFFSLLCLAAASAAAEDAPADLPSDIPAGFVTGERRPIVTLHAAGAQIYECKAAADGTRAWTFREPIATLFDRGKTIGRHTAGPNWDFNDGSGVTGKVVASVPGAGPEDIPQLALQVVAHRGTGALTAAGTVLRLHTEDGLLTGSCDRDGDLRSVPYAADYVFLR